MAFRHCSEMKARDARHGGQTEVLARANAPPFLLETETSAYTPKHQPGHLLSWPPLVLKQTPAAAPWAQALIRFMSVQRCMPIRLDFGRLRSNVGNSINDLVYLENRWACFQNQYISAREHEQ